MCNASSSLDRKKILKEKRLATPGKNKLQYLTGPYVIPYPPGNIWWQCLVINGQFYDPSNQQEGARRYLFSENPRWSRSFDKVSYSSRKCFSHCWRIGVIHSCGKREIIGDIFSSRDIIRYDQGCLRYIKDTSDLLCLIISENISKGGRVNKNVRILFIE